MRAWVIRFVSLYLFDLVVLLLIGAFTPGVRVGWAALWAAVLLTAATIWLKPLVHRWFRSMAATSQAQRTKIGEKVVQYLLVLAVAAVIWVLVVVLTGVNVNGFFWLWGWVSPPLFLTVAWAVYDLVDDGVQRRAGALYDRATGQSAVARRPADDGLTDEQRRLLDGL